MAGTLSKKHRLPGRKSGEQKVFQRIFSEWFPATGYAHSGGPEIEVYLPGDPTSSQYRCQVWVPVIKQEA